MSLHLSHGGLWMAAAAVLLATAAVWHYHSLRIRLAPPRAAGIAALRCSLFLFLLLMVAGPVVRRERKESFRPVVAVGIDSSMSMGLTGGRGDTRFERARGFVESPSFREALADYYTELFAFDESARRLGPEDLATVEPGGRWTDIRRVMADAAGTENSQALVLLTDSTHDSEGLLKSMAGSPIPVVVMKVDGGEEFRDVEVVKLDGADIAFTGRPVDLEATVRASGFNGRELPVVLKEGGKVVSSQYVVFARDREEKRLAYRWSPPGPGRYHLTVEVPPQAGEEVPLNNALHLTVEVRRDKIRILLVSGRPSWNYRFIREALKGDPTVDLISFIILRSANDVVNVSQDELSLIPFPTRKIFLEELENFDLIIFENFSFRFYFPQQYLEKVKEFVEKGGGFWMLGGPLSFARGGYAGTPIAEMLPVKIKDVAVDRGYLPGSFSANVTEAGRRHPLLTGLDSRDYPSLTPLEGFNRTSGPAAKAVVLLEHAGDGAPLLAIGRHGDGRTLALTTDSIWKWNFEMAGAGRGKTFFLSLLRQAVRWSVGDPLMEPVRIALQKDRLMTGDELKGTIRAFSEDFVPAGDSAISVDLWSGTSRLSSIPLERLADGVYEFTAPAPPAGTYEVRASVGTGGEIYGSDVASLNVAWPAVELRGADEPLLELPPDMIARGHRIVEIAEYGAAARELKKTLAGSTPPYRVLTEEKRALGEEWWAFAVLFGLLAGEWLTRRRFGVE